MTFVPFFPPRTLSVIPRGSSPRDVPPRLALFVAPFSHQLGVWIELWRLYVSGATFPFSQILLCDFLFLYSPPFFRRFHFSASFSWGKILSKSELARVLGSPPPFLDPLVRLFHFTCLRNRPSSFFFPFIVLGLTGPV